LLLARILIRALTTAEYEAPQPGSADTWHALVELKLAAMEADLHAGGPDGAPGPVLQRLALPYEVSTAEA